MGNNPSTYKAGGDYPVERVNWAEAVYYANKLSKSEGLDTCYTIERCHGTAGVDLSSCDIAFKGLIVKVIVCQPRQNGNTLLGLEVHSHTGKKGPTLGQIGM